MTDNFDFDEDDVVPEEPDWQAKTYEVFNPDHTVGVASNRNGEVIGMHLTDDARDLGDTWLAAEILRVAKLAYEKSRVGLRAEMEHNGTLPYILESFGLPTEADYIAMENAAFGSMS